ncbi:hypothetical protein PIB30_000146 [Stylosanthes scabra]|uniref:Uncharacterized protein n=1 Tax=Stylosanthes scabra TaxID=79078 RepID=A0ABU6R2Q5_9FABA|nr:hypothetical protein [Stylosanthes scabra]
MGQVPSSRGFNGSPINSPLRIFFADPCRGGEFLRRNDIGPPTPGEGGPYRVTTDLCKGAYKLERLNGVELPRSWNATNL